MNYSPTGISIVCFFLLYKISFPDAPRLFELPQTRQVKDGHDMLSYSCALQNRADKPWYAWWEFQREGTNAIVPLPPFKKNAYDGFSVSVSFKLIKITDSFTF